MPQPLSDGFLRNWYERFCQELRIHASIDVNRREDLGRVKNFPIDRWQTDLYDNDKTLDYDAVFIKMPTYAFMPHDGLECLTPPPNNGDPAEYTQWVLDNVQTNISLDHIRNLYAMSQAGTLMIHRPDGGERTMMQVYTDDLGNITTSLPFDELESAAPTHDQKLGEQLANWAGAPKYVPPLNPADYGFPPKPEVPKRPENMNPGFLSWLGHLLGRNTDYTKKKQYKEDLLAYPEKLKKWENTIQSHENYGDYLEDKSVREQYEQDMKAYQSSPLGIHYAISAGYQGYEMDEKAHELKNYQDLVRHTSQKLKDEHLKTPLGKVTKGLFDLRDEISKPKATKNALQNLLAVNAAPDQQLEEWHRNGVIEKGKFKPAATDSVKGYRLPEIPLHEGKRRSAWWFDTYFLTSLINLGALTDENIIGTPAQEKFSNILKGLFTVGVPGSTPLLDYLNPAREKGAAAFKESLWEKKHDSASLLLGNALRFLDKEVCNQTNLNDEHTYHTLYIIDQIQTLLEKRPELANNLGLNEQEMHQIQADRATFRTLRASKLAQQDLVEHALGRKSLTPKALQQAVTDICFAKLITKLTAEGNKIDLTNPQSVTAAKQKVAELSGSEKVIAMDREGLGRLALNPSDFHRTFSVKITQFAESFAKAPQMQNQPERNAEHNPSEINPISI